MQVDLGVARCWSVFRKNLHHLFQMTANYCLTWFASKHWLKKQFYVDGYTEKFLSNELKFVVWFVCHNNLLVGLSKMATNSFNLTLFSLRMWWVEVSSGNVMWLIVISAQKATSYQVTTMLATSKNILFPGHNHALATGADDPSFTGAQVISTGQWLAGGYDLEIGNF